MGMRNGLGKITVGLGITAVALLMTTASIGPTGLGVTAAFAQSSDGQGNQGGQGQGSQGSQSGQGNQGGQGSGQGGPGPDSDGQGPQAGSPSDSTTGGKPAWAQEGIPEVELGRLNVARSPSQVLERAIAEALANISPEMIEFYSMDLDQMILELSTNFDNISFIDSPLQNLSLFQDALDGISTLTSLGVTNTTETLLATFLGVASDKTVPITPDTVVAVSTILGTPITDAEAAALAADAEAIRIAVLAGHG
jgi:hypothetical protein